ncbi:hypothetical protein ZWY2020_010968 [Hordeum vulgare]|nr:hypothetical protein ZWY2020_010968 [Hordeum vulgare]
MRNNFTASTSPSPELRRLRNIFLRRRRSCLQPPTTAATSSSAEASAEEQPQKKVLMKKLGSAAKSLPGVLKTKMAAGRGTRPSPRKIVNIPSASEGSEDYGDETLQANIRNKKERVTQANGKTIRLALDPKVLLNFIDLWYDDPNTPIDDLKLPPGLSHMVTSFVNEEKWKDQQAKKTRVVKVKKEKYLKQNILNLTPKKLVLTQAELKTLT